MDELERGTDIPAEDESFLDELYERALSAFEDGGAFDPAPWVERRGHLARAIESAVELAREVAASAGPRIASAAPSVPGYVLERELGHGAMGAVYLARQESLGGRRVALKVLAAAAAFSPRARQRFLREARALAKVRHAHVVPVYDVIESGEVCAYGMEWIEGASLERVLLALKERPPEERLRVAAETLGAGAPLEAESWALFVVRLGRDLARALAAVHDAGLLHRDVKPANVLLRTDGAVLLTDFSLVHDPEDTLVTRTGHFVGTPAYAAPEQLRGDSRRIDARSDLFGLGATLFEALTLRRAHRGRSAAELLAEIESGRPVTLRKHDPSLSRDHETVVAKCLTADRDRRYGSASELADDLERLLCLEPVRARRAGPFERFARTLRRERKRTVAALLGATLALVPAVFLAQRALSWLQRDTAARALHRRAELALLTPDVDGPIFEVAADGTGLRALIEGRVALQRRLERADVLAGQALRLDPSPAVAAPIALERHVLELVRWLVSREPPPTFERTPLTDRAARTLVEGGSLDWLDDAALEASAADDRRALGLFAFLADRDALALRAWAVPEQERGPLVTAAVGLVHLARDEADEAYPFLITACETYPEAGFLRVRLADASVRSGRLAEAEARLAEAEALELQDTLDTAKRVRAELLAARGADEDAERIFRGLVERRNAPTPALRFAHFLETRGRTEEGLRMRRSYAERRPDSIFAQAQFLDAAERWWASPADRLRRVRKLLAADQGSSGLGSLLRDLVACNEHLARLDPADAYTMPESTLPSRPSSSSAGDVGSLLELAQTLERAPMHANDPSFLSLLARQVSGPLGLSGPVGRGLAVAIACAAMAPAGVAQVAGHGKISQIAGGFPGSLDDGDQFGVGVCLLGDLDMDGIEEIAVSAPNDDDGGLDRGAVWILFLHADGSVRTARKISSTEGGFTGVLDDQDLFGFALAPLGDLDADGTKDLAVGALWDDDGATNAGAIWVLFLHADGTVKDEAKISATSGAFLGTTGNGFGGVLGSLGDRDGDGRCDLAVGVTGDDDGGVNYGALWLLYLNPDGSVEQHKKISATSCGFTGSIQSGERFGQSVGRVGDVDGDGIEELVVGADLDGDGGMWRGSVWILFMDASGCVKGQQKISSLEGGLCLGALDNLDQFGFSVAGIGDANGDSVPDIAVGAIFDDDGGPDRGAVWILHLTPIGTVSSCRKISSTVGGFPGPLHNDDRFGTSLAHLGDFDDNCNLDLAVGCSLDDDGGPNRGAVWKLEMDWSVQARVSARTAGTNPTSLSATLPILGSTVTLTVDLTTSGHPYARLLQSDKPIRRPLPGGQVLLVGGRWTLKAVLGSGPVPGAPGPTATFQIPIPNDPALCGKHLYTQAVHTGGVSPFALSNSQDLVFGR